MQRFYRASYTVGLIAGAVLGQIRGATLVCLTAVWMLLVVNDSKPAGEENDG